MGLKVARVLSINISVVGEDWGAGYHLHVNGGILGLFVPKRGIVILILRDKRNSDDIHKWHTSNTPSRPKRVLTLSNTLMAVEVSRVSEG
jgi:hypothetical protein